ncbi:DNA mismatch repair protein MSH4 isoform X2 [Cryptomeria japonica]|uniref:DNA mismatch repair protein MSH4 isoform X2 n=1 Tax=Cryptomeria japonica TaxID=3369 RepID=UPI0027DA07BB|nr:DNA mismatch repair protein MSH4 isoform X2 [Cryptomeria japonica]
MDGGDRSSFIVGIIENRAKEVGLAAFDLRTAALHLSQFIETSHSYQNTKTLLYYYDPTDIIVPQIKMAPDGMAGVSALVDSSYSLTNKVILARGCFDDTKGAMLVKNLAVKESSALILDTYYKQYYLGLAAAAATIKWVESEKGISITNHSVLITFNGSFDHMSIDTTSVQNLELIEPLASIPGLPSNKKNSLFHTLNSTKTVGGSRLLRANLLQPLKDIETINARLDCLDELTSNENLFFGLSQVLQKIPKDIDRVLCHFCFKPKKLSVESSKCTSGRRSQMIVASVVLLKEALEALPLLSEVLKNAKSFLLCKIHKSICENETIEEVIDADVCHARAPFVMRTQQCFAVKSGLDGFLDVARKSFCDTSEAIHALAKKYREDMNLPNLKIPFNNRQGFYMSMPEKDLPEGGLPKIFIQVTKQGKNIHCSTQQLISLNIRNKSAATECYIRTERCLEGLIDSVREDIFFLILLSESLCLLDMIVNSFAHMILSKPVDHYTRPEFTENGPMAIEAGRHPVIECIRPGGFVANNTFLSEASNMVIIMGPNMSGKSTFLKQVCLIVILAQIGCYVPAHFATFRVVDRLFTRIGTGDNLETNSSTFMTEMKETAFIVQNVSPRSLIVIDELGRATSSLDGLAIAWSCCEYLLSLQAYTIFATHMERLADLASMYPNVKVCHFQVDVKANRMDFKFALKGLSNVPHYGLLLASVAGLPNSVVEEAKCVTQKIMEEERSYLQLNHKQYLPLRKEYHVAQKVLCLKYANMSEEDLRSSLQTLKESFIDGRI